MFDVHLPNVVSNPDLALEQNEALSPFIGGGNVSDRPVVQFPTMLLARPSQERVSWWRRIFCCQKRKATTTDQAPLDAECQEATDARKKTRFFGCFGCFGCFRKSRAKPQTQTSTISEQGAKKQSRSFWSRLCCCFRRKSAERQPQATQDTSVIWTHEEESDSQTRRSQGTNIQVSRRGADEKPMRVPVSDWTFPEDYATLYPFLSEFLTPTGAEQVKKYLPHQRVNYRNAVEGFAKFKDIISAKKQAEHLTPAEAELEPSDSTEQKRLALRQQILLLQNKSLVAMNEDSKVKMKFFKAVGDRARMASLYTKLNEKTLKVNTLWSEIQNLRQELLALYQDIAASLQQEAMALQTANDPRLAMIERQQLDAAEAVKYLQEQLKIKKLLQ